MSHGTQRFIAYILLISLLSQPLIVVAQTTGTQQFNPNATLNTGGGTFGGITFSGVGGAIAACNNAGNTLAKWTGGVSNSISSLFNSKPASAQRLREQNSTPIATNPTIDASHPSIANTVTGTSNPVTSGRVDPNQYVNSITNAGHTESVPVSDSSATKALDQANKREDCLNGIAYAIAKSMLQQVVGKTISLVNTGNFGNPYYVRNIDSYLGSIANDQVQQFLEKIPNQNPIFGNAIRSIITQQVTGVQDGLLSATMNTPEGQAYQSFQTDFTNGGWNAFLDPNFSSLNALFNAADNLSRNINSQQQDVQNQLQRNGGFLDMKKCVEYASAPSTGDGGTNQSQTGTAAQCLTWETVTPGSVISAQINAVTTSPIRQLEQADRINEVLGSFFDQMLNNIFAQGLSALRGKNYGGNGNSFTLGTSGSNTVVGSTGTAIQTAEAGVSALGYSSTTLSGVSSTDFDVSRPQQIRTVLKVQYDYLNRAEDAQVAERRIIPVLGALDYCIPGPNPTWQDGLNDNINTYESNLQVPATNTSNTGATIGSTIGGLIPGVGSIGSVIGGLIGGLFDGNKKPHGVAALSAALYDKVTAQSLAISPTAWREPGHSPQNTFDNMDHRLQSVLQIYKDNYTNDNITNAFVAVDSANADYARGFAQTALDETTKLPAYDQAIASIDNDYITNIANTKLAITELEQIREQADSIVATAKARYIAEQAAAGTPVNQTCLDNAYQLDTSPITVDPRVESDTPSPFAAPSSQATLYFYNNL